MFHLFSLRIILPAVILVFAAGSIWFSYQTARQAAIDDAVARVAIDARNNLTLLQGSIVQFLNSKNESSVQQITASMAAKPDLAVFVVVNYDDAVVASTRYNLVGHDWRMPSLSIDPEYVSMIRRTRSTDVYIDRSRGTLDGYSVLCVDLGPQVLRSDQCGFIYYRISLEYHYKNALELVKQEALTTGWGLLVGTLILILAIDFFVTRRVRKLKSIIRDFSTGNRAARSKCWGYDELRLLGDTVNELMDRINEDEQELRAREQRLDTLFDIIIDAIVVIDDRGRMQRVNQATTKLFGYEALELEGRNVQMLMPEPYRKEHDQYVKNYLHTGEKKIIGTGREVVAKRKDGTTFPIELSISEMRLGDERIFVGVMRNITERKAMEESLHQYNDALLEVNRQLEVSALTDGLTGLANRRHFDQALSEAVNWATRKGCSMALLICDVDFFKKYNDLYGHQAGDECLQKVAQAIAHQFQRSGEVAARYGGEEFAVILPEVSQEQVVFMAERLVDAVGELAIEHQSSSVKNVVTLSVGYSVYTPSSNTPPSNEVFINHADAGLYRAKELGRNRVAEGEATIGT